MKFLETTIKMLDRNDAELFKKHLVSKKASKKTLELFNLISDKKNLDASVIARKLYQPLNLNAYHTLRKRLMLQLTQFISNKEVRNQNSSSENITGLVSLSEFMLEKGEVNLSNFFLNKAEKLAVHEEKTELLNIIYHLQIANADKLKKNLDQTIFLWKKNNEKLQINQQLDVAYAIIKKKLADARFSGNIMDPDETISSVFTEFNISNEVANNAAFMFKIVSMTRSAIVSSKDYYRIEGSTMRIYDRLKKVNAFNKKDAKYEIRFLYIISHVLYRNRKFDDASEWVEKMNQALSYKTFVASPYYCKYIMLRAAIDTFSWKNTEAISILSKALKGEKRKLDVDEKMNMQLNLAVNLFQAEDYKKCNAILGNIGHSDLWIERKMGKEWRFKKNMIEIIVQYELGNDDVSLKKIKSIEKIFDEFLSHPSYARARMFLRFIRKVVQEPWIVTTEAFAEQVKEARMGLPQDKEDIQAISFFCWLKSKMLKRKYYDVLVQTMRDRSFK
jgi:hypothetical protein